VLVICCCRPPAELALQWQWCDPVSTSWLELSPVYSLTLRPRPVFGTASARSVGWTMTRPRGRPRRGSPWKPRRPSVSPSDSPSISSSPRHHSGHLSAYSHDRMNSHSTRGALVPRTSSSPLHYPHSPSVTPFDPTSDFDPLGFLGGVEHSQHASRGAGPLPRGPFTNVQLWDSMAALYDLVFGIRQGVEDLNYRLQETRAKVDLFLRTLTSLQSSLTSSSTEDAPMEEPDAATAAATGTTTGAAPGAATGATTDAKSREQSRGHCGRRGG
jgi:hypothetical protein